MDNLRGFESLDPTQDLDAPDYAHFDDEPEDNGIETVPVVSGNERRMQVRAYNFWITQLGNRSYPAIEDLHPEKNDDFADFSVLLDFTSGVENPSIPYLGQKLREACGITNEISYLDEVPARSLLSRITDHYLQIIANHAPIGFEAEFVNDQDITIMYRGILLPYSSDDDTIDFIYGVINWKEVADEETTQSLQAEVAAAMDNPPNPVLGVQPQQRDIMPAWGDSVSDLPTESVGDEDIGAPEYHESNDTEAVAAQMPVSEEEPLELGADYSISDDEPDDGSSLADWLVSARSLASDAEAAAVRSREALYAAIGRAWDFALAAQAHPEDYAELLEDSGIAAQERAPMTPIVKLVFGAHYDKTRLTEFAAALSYANNNEIPRGTFGDYISNYAGGLKAIVQAERRARKVARGDHVAPLAVDPRERLRGAATRDLSEFAGPGEEFVVLVARRNDDGSLSLVGAVDGDEAFTEKALNHTVI